MNRIKEAKRKLSEIKKPSSSFELKYHGMTAPYAWDHFFRLFFIKLGAAVVGKAQAVERNLDPTSLLELVLDDIFTRLSTVASEHSGILAYYGDRGYQGAFSENKDDIHLIIAALRDMAKECIDLADQNQLTQYNTYKTYEAYLQGLLKVAPGEFFEDYLLKLKSADASAQPSRLSTNSHNEKKT